MNTEAQTLISEARDLLARSLPHVFSPRIAEGIADFLVTGSIEGHVPYSTRATQTDLRAGSTLAAVRFFLRDHEDPDRYSDLVFLLHSEIFGLRKYLDKHEA